MVTLSFSFDISVYPDRADFLIRLLSSNSLDPKGRQSLLQHLLFHASQPENIRLASKEESEEEDVVEELEWVRALDFIVVDGQRDSLRSRSFNAIYRGRNRASSFFPALKDVRMTGSYDSLAICRQDLVAICTGAANQDMLIQTITNFGPKCLKSMCEYLDIEYELD